MNDEVGQDVELSFPVVTEAGFPWGLKCPLCDRSIEIGQPYETHLENVDEFEAITLITCVYCLPSEGDA